MERVIKMGSAAVGAIVSIATGIPVIMWVLVGVMTLDYVTGLICGAMGRSEKTEGGGLSSKAAFQGLLKKAMVLIVVALACLIDLAIAQSAGLVSFHATTGATCLWFVASEGISIVENAARIGLPVPGIVLQALETMRGAGEKETKDGKEKPEEQR